MGNILSRIQEIAVKEGITITAMERSIGASKGVLSRAIANGTDIQSKWLQNIVENYPLYSADWLITGRGSMLRHEPTSTNSAPTASLSINNDFVSIPLVDISVAAGCCGYDNPDYLEVVDTIKMPSSMVRNSEKYFCVRIKGESMSPTLLDSSYVIVRLLDRSEWQDMPDQHIYVISDTDGRSYIKRIKNRFRQHGFLVCMSDNVDKINYPNFNLEAQEINTILHAEWYFSAKMPNLNETYYDKVNQLEDDMDVMKGQMVQIQQLLRAINAK